MCLYFEDHFSGDLNFAEFQALLFSLFAEVFFQDFQNCLGLSFKRPLVRCALSHAAAFYRFFCPNSVTNSRMKQAGTKAVQSLSVTFGPSFISTGSVCFNEEGSIEAL